MQVEARSRVRQGHRRNDSALARKKRKMMGNQSLIAQAMNPGRLAVDRSVGLKINVLDPESPAAKSIARINPDRA